MRSNVTIINHWGAALIISLTSHSYHYHVITIFCFLCSWIFLFFFVDIQFFFFFFGLLLLFQISQNLIHIFKCIDSVLFGPLKLITHCLHMAPNTYFYQIITLIFLSISFHSVPSNLSQNSIQTKLYNVLNMQYDSHFDRFQFNLSIKEAIY